MQFYLRVLALAVLLSAVTVVTVAKGKMEVQGPDNIKEAFQLAWTAVATSFSKRGPEESVANLSEYLCKAAATKAALNAYEDYILYANTGPLEKPIVEVDFETTMPYAQTFVNNVSVGYNTNEAKDNAACELWKQGLCNAFSANIPTEVGIGAFEFQQLGKSHVYVVILLKSIQYLPLTKQDSTPLDFMSAVDRDKITDLFYKDHFKQTEFKLNRTDYIDYLATDDLMNIGETGINGKLIVVWRYRKPNDDPETLKRLLVHKKFQESFKCEFVTYVGEEDALYGLEVVDEIRTKELFRDYNTDLVGGFLLCFIQRPQTVTGAAKVQPTMKDNIGRSTNLPKTTEVSPQRPTRTPGVPPVLYLLDSPVPSDGLNSKLSAVLKPTIGWKPVNKEMIGDELGR